MEVKSVYIEDGAHQESNKAGASEEAPRPRSRSYGGDISIYKLYATSFRMRKQVPVCVRKRSSYRLCLHFSSRAGTGSGRSTG